MSTNKFLNANISVKDLMSLPTLSVLVLPSGDSNLLKKNPGYLDELVAGRVIQIRKADLPMEIDFEVEISLRSEALFGELLRIAVAAGKNPMDVASHWGFDAKELPDPNFLLKAIWFWDHESPIVACLPRKKLEILGPQQKAYEEQKLFYFLEQVQKTGKVVKAKTVIDFAEIRPHIEQIQQAYLAYYTAKYEVASLKNNANRAIAQAESNSTVRAILSTSKIVPMLSHGDWGLQTPTLRPGVEAVNAFHQRMQIEADPLPAPRGDPPKPEVPPQKHYRGRQHHRNRVNPRDPDNNAD